MEEDPALFVNDAGIQIPELCTGASEVIIRTRFENHYTETFVSDIIDSRYPYITPESFEFYGEMPNKELTKREVVFHVKNQHPELFEVKLQR